MYGYISWSFSLFNSYTSVTLCFQGLTAGTHLLYILFYLPQARSIAKALSDADYDMVYAESAGDHNWYFWDRVVKEFILALPLRGGV